MTLMKLNFNEGFFTQINLNIMSFKRKSDVKVKSEDSVKRPRIVYEGCLFYLEFMITEFLTYIFCYQ